MKLVIYISGFLLLLLQNSTVFSQNMKDCLKEVVDFEEKINYRKDTLLNKKNMFISYSVKVTDWENNITVSNVKIYKNEEYMHFFSEQANIYQDSKEVVMILPIQKMAIISSTTKELNNTKISDAFFEMRRKFIDSCEIIRCDIAGSKKTLELKVKKHQDSNNIIGIIYEYDIELGKILFVKISYNQDYKVKTVQINYKDFVMDSNYQYSSSRRYMVDRNGKLLSKLNGYELVDNRDQKKKNKK